MESKLEASKLFECKLPNEIWCEVFSYLDKKSLNNVTSTCKLLFGIIRGNEKFSGHVKMKFTDLKNLSKNVTDSEWLRGRWPSMRVLEVSLGYQFLGARHMNLLYKMTKFMKLKPLALKQKRKKIGFSCGSEAIYSNVRYCSRFFVPTTSNQTHALSFYKSKKFFDRPNHIGRVQYILFESKSFCTNYTN